MVSLRLYHDTPIDTSSPDFIEKVAESVKNLVKRDWEKITTITDESDDERYQCLVTLQL